MRGSVLCAAYAVVVLLLGCASAMAHDKTCQDPAIPSRDMLWRQAPGAHPLVGVVLEGDIPVGIEASPCLRSPLQQMIAELWAVLAEGGIVLLGEVHDNPEHHLVRADFLRSAPYVDAWQTPVQPAVVFEHLHPAQQVVLDDFYRQSPESRQRLMAADLLDRLGWKDSGWPAAAIFAPLFDAALDAGLPIRAGDAPRERVRALAQGGKAVLDPEERERLAIGETMDQASLEALNAEIAESHCGALPASAFASMSLAQRYRDAHLAESVVKAAAASGGAVLLAGNGHVRTDRAVPWYVHKLAPKRKVVAVTLLEVRDGERDAASYLPRDPEGHVASDYVLFTPRVERPDPCLRMQERMQTKSP